MSLKNVIGYKENIMIYVINGKEIKYEDLPEEMRKSVDKDILDEKKKQEIGTHVRCPFCNKTVPRSVNAVNKNKEHVEWVYYCRTCKKRLALETRSDYWRELLLEGKIPLNDGSFYNYEGRLEDAYNTLQKSCCGKNRFRAIR